ncbi:MAG: HupE/UreJ family protein [Bacteroidota bacterium]
MENTFLFYFRFGLSHILDWAALDHILFLVALCAIYTLLDWRKVLLLVTAFTIGHCASLIVAGMDWVRLPAIWIESLIPATIMITAIYNLWMRGEEESRQIYLMALVFGLIHGLGFSNTFRSMLFADEQVDLWWYLLAFNLGVEVGQVIIVLLILGVAYVAVEVLQIKRKWWSIGLSVVALVLAGWMLVERLVMG